MNSLYDAIGTGDAEACRRMLDERPELVSEISEDYGSPLFHAIDRRRAEIAKMLIERGAGAPQSTGRTGECLLFLAADKGLNETVQLLLAKGADPRPSDEDGDVMAVAQSTRNKDLIGILLNYGFPMTPCIAASLGDMESLRKIVDEDASAVFFRDSDGKTPLHWAAYNGHLEIARFLLANGADVNAMSLESGLPLYDALTMVSPEPMVSLLLEAGTDVSSKIGHGQSPLLSALWMGRFHAALLLLKAGSDPNLADNDGQTPLWLAISLARPDCQDKAMPLIDGLLEAGADPNPEPVKAVLNILEWVELRRKWPDHTDYYTTLLILAVASRNVEAVKSLLKHGADINAKDSLGHTPIVIAEQLRDEEITKLLASHGARRSTSLGKSGALVFSLSYTLLGLYFSLYGVHSWLRWVGLLFLTVGATGCVRLLINMARRWGR